MLGKRLKPGATIGIISPSSPADREDIKNGIIFFNNLGFNIKEGKYIYDNYGYLAAEDYKRAEDLNNMFLDDEVDMILCVRGGYGSMRILDKIDYNAIKNNPKIFIGYSDITPLLNYFNKYLNIITFHGPMLTSDFNHRYTLNSFLTTLMEGYLPYKIDNSPYIDTFPLIKGVARGKLVGGNLSLICSTLNTPYEIHTENSILFIEEVGESPYRIDRMLTQLILSGKLHLCNGFILGQFTQCEPNDLENSFALKEVINDRLCAFKKPILCNFMSGHHYPKLTLPIGATVKLDCCKNKIYVESPVVE